MAIVNDNSNGGDSPEDRLMRVIADCMERQDRGERIDRMQLLRENPDVAPRLVEYFDDLDVVQDVAAAAWKAGNREQASRDSVSIKSRDQSTDHHESETGREPLRETQALPQQIGRYQILSPLGSGGMGTVFLVNDPHLNRKVALKLPRINTRNESSVHARFLREAQAAARLRHEHICRIHDYGEIDGTPFYTMEYIEGTPLSEKFPKAGFADVDEAVAIVRSVADAMSEAHQNGVIHRDLKPGNIILDKRSRAIVVDFGLAREVVRNNDDALTETGMIVGTVGYMSPEQIFGRADAVGPASDIWSLGIIFHELLTGHQPFQGAQTEVLAKILRDEPDKPSDSRPDVATELDAICGKMLQKNPADRYASMSDVVKALDEYRRREPSGTQAHRATTHPSHVATATKNAGTMPATLLEPSTAAPRRSSRRKVVALLIGTAAICLAGLVLILKAGGETVAVQISKEIADNDYTVVFDLDSDFDKELNKTRLTAGKHTWRVMRGEKTIVAQGEFEVQRGKDNSVDVTLRPDPLLAVPPAQPFVLDSKWRPVAEPLERFKDVVGFAFGPDSRTLIIATNASLELYDPYTQTTLANLKLEREGPIQGFAASRNGRFVALVFDEAIDIWQFPEAKRLPGIARKSNAWPRAAFSDDGQFFAAPIDDHTIGVYNSATGERIYAREIPAVAGKDRIGDALALSPDGLQLAHGDFGNSVIVWDLKSAREKFRCEHKDRIYAICFTPDGRHLLTAGNERIITVWNAGNGASEQTIPGHADTVTALAISANGRHIASGSDDKTYRVWELATGSPEGSWQTNEAIAQVAFSADGGFLAANAASSAPSLLATPAGFTLEPDQAGLAATLFHPTNRSISATAISPDGRHFAAAGKALRATKADQISRIAIWDLFERRVALALDVGFEGVKRLHYSPDGTKLVAMSGSGEFQFWDSASGAIIHPFQGVGFGVVGQGKILDFDILPNGDLVLAGSLGLQIVDSETLTTIAEWHENDGGFRSVAAFSNRHEILTGADRTAEIELWDAARAERLRSWEAGPGRIDLIRLSKSGDCSLTGSLGTFDLRNPRDSSPQSLLELRRTPTGQTFTHGVAALSHNGTAVLLASGSQLNATVYFINAATGRVLLTGTGHSAEVTAVQFSLDDRIAISADGSGSFKIWRLPEIPDADRAAAEWVLSKGGRVTVIDQQSARANPLEAKDSIPVGRFYCREINLGKIHDIPATEFGRLSGLSRLVELNVSDTQITDAGLAEIIGLPALKILTIGPSRITDEGVGTLARFRYLTQLNLEQSQITSRAVGKLNALPLLENLSIGSNRLDDAAMLYFRGLRSLRSLNLNSTMISDEGLKELDSLPRLDHLKCYNTRVTAAGVESLKSKLPHLRIDWEGPH